MVADIEVFADKKDRPMVRVMMAGGPEPLNFCRWGTEHGCKYGKRCKFQHWELPDRASRCWLCSSTQHRKMECPSNQRKEDQNGGKKLEESPGKDGKGKTKKGSPSGQPRSGEGGAAARDESAAARDGGVKRSCKR